MTGYTGFELRTAAPGTLEPGDRGPFFVLRAEDGDNLSPLDDRHAGRTAVVILRPGQSDPAGLGVLDSFNQRRDAFAALGANLFLVTRDGQSANQAQKAERGLAFPVLSDPEGKVFEAFGLAPNVTAGATGVTGATGATIVLDEDFRIATMLGGAAGDKEARFALAAAKELASLRPTGSLRGHAPVLVLPRVLSPQDCERLIAVWHRDVRVWDSDGLTSRGHDEETTDFKVRIETYGKILQHIIKDPDLTASLDALCGRRINPEIQKAFQTKVSQREDYRIACYDAGEAGALAAHRDNPTPQTRHRRFTFTIALNAATGGGETFEGGGLRFPEYGAQVYQVETGTAIVWSAALLHEVPAVTKGRRFVLGAHLYGE